MSSSPTERLVLAALGQAIIDRGGQEGRVFLSLDREEGPHPRIWQSNQRRWRTPWFSHVRNSKSLQGSTPSFDRCQTKKRWKIKTAKKDTSRLSSPHWHHQRVQKSQEQRPGCDVGGRALVSDRTLLAWGCQVQFPQPLPPSPQRAKTRAKGSSSGLWWLHLPRTYVGSGSRRRGSSTFGGGNHQPSVRPSTPD